MESGTLSIQSTNCTWTGGNLDRRRRRHLQLAPAGGNGIILTGTYTGSGGGQVQFSGGTLLDRQRRGDLRLPPGPVPVDRRHHQRQPGGTLTNTGFLTLSNAGASR